ncbi:protection of telomeres protein 1 isoform X2 [Danio aesculapii]|uniref:protection of telomeres protein 1 isoform X2 n=1 Tax=Danio aesculapii TaxID=1142201 RepID=UPI0024C0ABEC|nr:protection of telomeres protein 1 isoform X2 [Danio aesculapii]
MPVEKVNNSSDLDAKVPSCLQLTSIGNLTLTSDPSHRCVKAKVVRKGPVISCPQRDDVEMLRAEIKEEDPLQSTTEHTSINVIFFDTLAKDFSQSVTQGDIVLIADFTIKKSPTFLRDNLHPCHLEMDNKDACIYVCPSAIPGPSRSEAKYIYVPLNKLKSKTMVNVYGVVTFFKQPFPSRGSDYCSTLKITDQSDVKVICTIFCKKLEDHPLIFRVGDIIRLHRFKAETFRDSITLMNTFGWSTVTFNGIIDSPIVPRTSSKSFYFGEADKRTVQKLRQWAANQSLCSDLNTSLSSVQPHMYFDFTCQLLAKAVMDSRCILLKVWDGTRCQHPLLKVAVAPDELEGECTLAKDKMNLTANVLVYDNHLEVARDLKPGAFLRFYNLHALLQKAPGQLPDQPEHLSFHLHGGTVYGRGLRSLPAETPDLLSLKSVLEKHVDLDEHEEVNDGTLLEIWYTPPESIGAEADAGPAYTADALPAATHFWETSKHTDSHSYTTDNLAYPIHLCRMSLDLWGKPEHQEETHAKAGRTCKLHTERPTDPDEARTSDLLATCEHNTQRITLAQVKRSTPPLSCHVRARVKKYLPQQLYQCLKLFCSKCKTMKDVPDDSAVANIFLESARDNQPCDEQWAATSSANSREPGRTISMHVSKDMVGESSHMQLIFIEGITLDEISVLSRDHKNLVPVRSENSKMTRMDLTAPFLFSGKKRYYGCKECSQNTFENPVFTGVETWDELAVAEVLGVQMMQYRFLIQFELDDGTDRIEALLWEDAERFFHISALDASGCQDLQDKIQTIMDTIQPPESSLEEHPWMDFCLSVYTVKDNDRKKVCYQITNTEIVKQ